MNPWEHFQTSAVKGHIAKYLYDILQDRYPRNEALISRLISALISTSIDIEEFGKFVADLYETGYLKCLKDHKEALEKRGLTAKVVAPPQEGTKIFNQKTAECQSPQP